MDVIIEISIKKKEEQIRCSLMKNGIYPNIDRILAHNIVKRFGNIRYYTEFISHTSKVRET